VCGYEFSKIGYLEIEPADICSRQLLSRIEFHEKLKLKLIEEFRTNFSSFLIIAVAKYM